MAHYQDLSRRALIKLNESFDKEHDDVLLKYLNEHIDELEGKTAVENVTEKVEGLSKTCSSVANKVIDEFFGSLDKLIDDYKDEKPMFIVKTLGLGE